MAIKNCKECGGNVSSKAKECPHCGFVCNRQYGCLSFFFLLCVIAVTINIVVSSFSDKPGKSPTIQPDEKVSQKPTGKELKAQKETKSQSQENASNDYIRNSFSSWDGSHTGLERFIKKKMNDPSSYEHIETRYIDKGDHMIVNTSFRGKNKFGALVKNTVVAKTDLDGNVINVLSQMPD